LIWRCGFVGPKRVCERGRGMVLKIVAQNGVEYAPFGSAWLGSMASSVGLCGQGLWEGSQEAA
jgi:hypothetical protein